MKSVRQGRFLSKLACVAAMLASLGLARAGSILYAVDSANQLLTINPSTGAATLADTFTNSLGAAIGIGASGQLLYVLPGYAGGTGNATQLISLDPNNSFAAGTVNLGLAGGGVNALSQGDLAFDLSGNLTIASATQKSGSFSSTNGALYSANLGTNTTTTLQSSFAPKFNGIAYDSTGDLFGLSQEVSNGSGGFINSLYSFNPSTFAPSVIGLTGITDSSANTFAGLAFALDGTLYAILGNTTSSRLFTINPTTGTATLVANILLGGNPIGAIDGAVFLNTSSPVPEPATLALISVAVGRLVFIRRRRVR
jgi:hypothetical protein